MYQYSSGLRCTASNRRIKAFEKIVPPLFAIVLISGFVSIPVLIINSDFGLLFSLCCYLFGNIVWAIFVAYLFSITFNVWCRPTVSKKQINKFGRNTSAKT